MFGLHLLRQQEESDSQITAPTEQQLREDSEAIIRNMYGTTGTIAR